MTVAATYSFRVRAREEGGGGARTPIEERGTKGAMAEPPTMVLASAADLVLSNQRDVQFRRDSELQVRPKLRVSPWLIPSSTLSLDCHTGLQATFSSGILLDLHGLILSLFRCIISRSTKKKKRESARGEPFGIHQFPETLVQPCDVTRITECRVSSHGRAES